MASLAFIAIPVLALTDRIDELSIWPPWRLTLIQATAIVVGLRLCRRWLADRVGDAELLLLPLVLLVLIGLNLGEVENAFAIHWEGWLSVGLCALLFACALVERNGGVPEEIWRVNRISAGEN